MGTAALRKHLETITGGPFAWRSWPETELLPNGIPEVDARAGGLPRGAFTASIRLVRPERAGSTAP